jgi:hypothetical protein
LELPRGDPRTPRATAEDRRDSTAAPILQRVQAETDLVEVWRRRPRAAEVPRTEPARTAETRLDALGVRKAAARTKRLLDLGKAIETFSTKRPIEWERERAFAQETNRGK